MYGLHLSVASLCVSLVAQFAAIATHSQSLYSVKWAIFLSRERVTLKFDVGNENEFPCKAVLIFTLTYPSYYSF